MDLQAFLKLHWDRVAAWVLVGVGIVMLVVGWLGVADQPFAAGQIPYVVSAGLGGLVAVGIGTTLWLSADLRDEWHQLNAIESTLRQVLDDPEDVPATAPVESEAPADLVAAVRTRKRRRAPQAAP